MVYYLRHSYIKPIIQVCYMITNKLTILQK